MTIGTSIFLIAVGAILRYATNLHVKGVNLDEAGLILMIVGVIALVLSILYEVIWAGERSRYYRYWGRGRYAPPPDPEFSAFVTGKQTGDFTFFAVPDLPVRIAVRKDLLALQHPGR